MAQEYLHRARNFVLDRTGQIESVGSHADPEARRTYERNELNEERVPAEQSAAAVEPLLSYESNELYEKRAMTMLPDAETSRGCIEHSVDGTVTARGWWLAGGAISGLRACTCCGGVSPPGMNRCWLCTPGTGLSLAAYAADLMPDLRFTLRETDDVVHDVQLLRQIRLLIAEQQPGANHLTLTIIKADGCRIRADWQALATRDLRLGIARLLARDAQKRRLHRTPPGVRRVARQEG